MLKALPEIKLELSNFKKKDEGHVSFGDNAKEKIIDIGNIVDPSSPSMKMFY